MLHDWRFAARSVAQRRGSSTAILITLTLAIGANSAIFSAVDAVLLKPLPYADPERLVAVYEAKVADNNLTSLVAPVRIEEWNRASQAFDGIAGSYFENATDTTGTVPERVAAMRTSPRFFDVLGVPAAIGRTFTAEEERFGGPPVAVVSDAFWRARLNGDPSAVGRVRMIGGVNRTIVGVMPPSFRYPTAATEVWIPAAMYEALLTARQARFYRAVGRLKPGITPEQARADLDAIQRRAAAQLPETDAGWTASVMPLKEQLVGGVRRSLWLLFGAVLLVLVAACGNIACLLLAQAVRREHEMAVRFALGATRQTLVAQMFREGILLAIGGSVGGLLLARWAVQLLRTGTTNLPHASELDIDLRLVGFALALGVVTTVFFAIAPALHATRGDVTRDLAGSGRGQVGGHQLLQRALVTTQVALAIVLLVGAGLLIRSFHRLQQVSPGFDAGNVLTFRMSAAWSEQPGAVVSRQLRTLQRLLATPGVISAAINSRLPASADFPPIEFKILGRDLANRYFAIPRQVSADYFQTLGIAIERGSTCRDDPRRDAPPTVLVNRSFAERFFPGQSPIGHYIVQRTKAEIVGIVSDIRERALTKAPEPVIYDCGLMPLWPDPYFIVRLDPSRAVTIGTIRAVVQEIEPQRAVYDVATLDSVLSESISQPRLNTLLLASFAGMALLLAGIGLYGMLAQFVNQRRREIGLRLALGASRGRVLRQLLRHGALVTGTGTIVGVVVSMVLARLMSSLMFEISSSDPATFTLVPLVLGLIAAVATIVPARRAARIDPMAALRDE